MASSCSVCGWTGDDLASHRATRLVCSGALGMSVTTARIRNRGTDATASIPRNRHILSAMLSLPKVRRGPILGDGPAVSNERSSDGLRDRTIVSSSTSERTPGLATDPSSIPDDSERDARRSTDATQYPISHASARGLSEASKFYTRQTGLENQHMQNSTDFQDNLLRHMVRTMFVQGSELAGSQTVVLAAILHDKSKTNKLQLLRASARSIRARAGPSHEVPR